MGESEISRDPQMLLRKEVSEKDLYHANRIWDYLYKSKLNRNVQPDNNELISIREKINPNWPTIFYAGQNDFESGMQPYTENSRKFHSPCFQTSIEAAIYLGNLAKKNKWNFIFKLHPLMRQFISSEQYMPNNVIRVDNININDIVEIADLNITILSTVSYVSLIRKKATLMLGYIQLKDKGCTYQAFEKENIEQIINIALKEGFTKNQSDAFCLHIAQLVKYYLLDDLQDRSIRYGRDISQILND
jgi:hypothetical protein